MWIFPAHVNGNFSGFSFPLNLWERLELHDNMLIDGHFSWLYSECVPLAKNT